MGGCIGTSTLSNVELSTTVEPNKLKTDLFNDVNLWLVNVIETPDEIFYSNEEHGIVKGKYVVNKSECCKSTNVFTIFVDDNYVKLIIKPQGTMWNNFNWYDYSYSLLKSFNNYFMFSDPIYEKHKYIENKKTKKEYAH